MADRHYELLIWIDTLPVPLRLCFRTREAAWTKMGQINLVATNRIDTVDSASWTDDFQGDVAFQLKDMRAMQIKAYVPDLED